MGVAAGVGVAALAKLDAAVVALLLPVRPALMDGREALLAKHRRRLEDPLVREAAPADHAAAVVRDDLLLHAREHHDVVHGLVVVRRGVGAHHDAGLPVAADLLGCASPPRREEHRHGEARLEHVVLCRHLHLLRLHCLVLRAVPPLLAAAAAASTSAVSAGVTHLALALGTAHGLLVAVPILLVLLALLALRRLSPDLLLRRR
mmetsp:Transcript_56047/g.134303  ORF Transcript_56047/g.134303 Transcript_56047/m.134303 type:complete len:204 (+) Transcript_56047:1120-1731(+)